MQFQENARTYGRTNERTDEQKDRLEDTSCCRWGSKKHLTAIPLGLKKLNSIKRYKVRKNMEIFCDILSLLTFQMSYIHHRVTILAYKVLIRNISTVNTPYGDNTVIIS